MRCKVGDVVEVKEKSRQMPLVLEAIKSPERDVPDYVEADHNRMVSQVPARAGFVRRALPRWTWSRTSSSSSTRANREFYSR